MEGRSGGDREGEMGRLKEKEMWGCRGAGGKEMEVKGEPYMKKGERGIGMRGDEVGSREKGEGVRQRGNRDGEGLFPTCHPHLPSATLTSSPLSHPPLPSGTLILCPPFPFSHLSPLCCTLITPLTPLSPPLALLSPPLLFPPHPCPFISPIHYHLTPAPSSPPSTSPSTSHTSPLAPSDIGYGSVWHLVK
ncbi:hypothetical protein Pcinc_034248 [Petrolisthes cinctipes]|uniref:Uncharacterized protein n=1 Tax=Petrolisthes cinctipes TaxID=88211 RepID=A0AAE1JX41_PETCI|nr:hypothetical protein Pcinc_034248 [Petrolisthes cinctipes]